MKQFQQQISNENIDSFKGQFDKIQQSLEKETSDKE